MFSACCVLLVALVQTSAPDSAVLFVSNRPVIVFRAPLGALSPGERASAARARILGLLEAPLDSVTVRTVPEGDLVLLGTRPLFTITPADVDTAGGASLAEEVASVVSRLRVGLAEEREARSLGHLLRAVGLALVATLILIVGLRILARGHRRMRVWVDGWGGRRFSDIVLRGFTLVRREQLLGGARTVSSAVVWAAGLVAGYLYVAYALTRFPQTRQWGEALGGYLVDVVRGVAGSILGAVPDLLMIAVVLVLARFVARLVGAFFRAVEAETIRIPGLHAETAGPSRRIAVALVWLFTLAVIYPFIPGSETTSFKGVSVFAGVLITLGSTGIIGQAMSGLVVMYTRALRPGDYVQVGEAEGVVSDVGLLSTKIRTIKQVQVTVPSSVLLSQNIKNFSRLLGDQGVVLHTSVTIGYDAPWRQVHALLQEAAGRTAGLEASPPPYIRQRALSDFYVEYELNAYTMAPERRAEMLSALHANIQDLFNEYGVQIMSPHYEGDRERPAVVPRERWYAPPAQAATAAPPAVVVAPRGPA